MYTRFRLLLVQALFLLTGSDVVSTFVIKNKSETRLTASVLKQDPNAQKVKKSAEF